MAELSYKQEGLYEFHTHCQALLVLTGNLNVIHFMVVFCMSTPNTMTLRVLYASSQVIAESLSEEEIGGLKELFKMIDADNSGTITFDELKEGLKRVGSELMESEIKDLMDAVRYLNVLDFNPFFLFVMFFAFTLT